MEDVLGGRSDVTALVYVSTQVLDVVVFNQALCGLYAAGLGGEVRGASHEAPVQNLLRQFRRVQGEGAR